MKYCAVLALAVQLLLISCSSDSNLQIISNTLTVREYTGDLNKIESIAIVTGTAINRDHSELEGCIVSVTFFDREKRVVGISSTSKQLMKPDEVWNFTVQLKGYDAWKVLSYDIEASHK